MTNYRLYHFVICLLCRRRFERVFREEPPHYRPCSCGGEVLRSTTRLDRQIAKAKVELSRFDQTA